MKSLRLLLPLVLVSSLAAQDMMPKPPAELAKYDVLLGNWTGSGTMRMEPDGAGEPWTAVSTGKKIMDGFAVQVDTKIDIGAPVPLMMREIYYWDTKRKNYASFACGNSGGAQTADVYWTEDGKLTYNHTGVEQGQLMHTAWTTTFEKDKLSFVGQTSIECGAFFPHVEGSMKRGGDGCDLNEGDANVALEPAGEELAPVARMKGNWSYTGWVKMTPDAPAMDVGGQEKIRSMFGGHVVAGVVKDDKTPYRDNSYIYWSKRDKCLKTFAVNNFGEAHAAKMFVAAPDQMVMVFAGFDRGHPVSGMYTSTFSGDSEITGVSTMLHQGKAVKTMEMKMSRAKP